MLEVVSKPPRIDEALNVSGNCYERTTNDLSRSGMTILNAAKSPEEVEAEMGQR